MVNVANKSLKDWYKQETGDVYDPAFPFKKRGTGVPGSGSTVNFPAGIITGEDNSNIPADVALVKGVPRNDDTYGRPITRVTDTAAEPITNHGRVDYSRRHAYNLDASMILISAEDGFWHVYNTTAGFPYNKVLTGPAGDTEANWSNSDPDKLWYQQQNGGLILYELTISTNTSVTKKDFTTELQAISGFSTAYRVWTKAEGMASADGRYFGFQVEDVNFAFLGLMVWDSQTDTITTATDAQLGNIGRPDHCSMSASGEYIVPSSDGIAGTRAYTRDFSSFKQLHHKSEHSDLGLLPNGQDFYVAVSYQDRPEYGYVGGDVFYKNIQTGETVTIFNSYRNSSVSAFHFSAKAFDVPGYVVISAYGQEGTRQFYHQKIMIIDLITGEYYHLCHTQDTLSSAPNPYFREAQGTTDRLLRFVAFNSDRSSTGTTEVYQVETGVTVSG